jgi:translation initiation factor IF-3
LRKANIFFKSNNQISAKELRVIGPDNKQIGILQRDEALKMASQENLDLVLIAEKASPPVAKIVDLGKFIYQEEKKLKKQKSKGNDLKEIRFSPFIGGADYETRLKRIREFLEDKDKVKLTVVFKGRQLGSKSFGYELLSKTVKELGEKIRVDSEPKFLGKHLSMIISPKSSERNKGEENAKS